MCAIFGFHRNATSSSLDQMGRELVHRGPDSMNGVQVGSYYLGFRRLAILDLDHGQQPFISPGGRVTSVCNGEIYNWKELREELENKGHVFRTQCDCEVLPAAWLEWGVELPKKLNGMFALAIHDQKEDTLFLARDCCGQKPLYLTNSSLGVFHFSSEIKAFRAVGIPLEPATEHLATWLSLRYVPEPATMYRGVETLPAGHYLLINSAGQRHQSAYWSASSGMISEQPIKRTSSVKRTEESYLDELDELVTDSVQRALQSDVPMALYLSAGVDSALLGHYIKEAGAQVESVSVEFGANSDEGSGACSNAQWLGMPHHSLQMTPQALTDLPRIIHQMDRPVGDALILAFDHLASKTSSLGCRVALGGEGPDEHFAGYSFQKAYLFAHKMGIWGRRIGAESLRFFPARLLDQMSQFPAQLGREGCQKVRRYLSQYTQASEYQRQISLRTLFEGSEIKRFLHPDLLEEQDWSYPERVYRSAGEGSLLNDSLSAQYGGWLPDWALIRQDKNAMAHSVEYRAPFLDHRLIAFAYALPDEMKIKGLTDKYLWRRLAARHLPSEVTHRPKQPFYLPVEDAPWRAVLLELCAEYLHPETLKKVGWINGDALSVLQNAERFLPLKQLSALLILHMWQRGL